jgi:hypothetical protein
VFGQLPDCLSVLLGAVRGTPNSTFLRWIATAESLHSQPSKAASGGPRGKCMKVTRYRGYVDDAVW